MSKQAARSYLLSVGNGDTIPLQVGGEYVRCIESEYDDFELAIDEDAFMFFRAGSEVRIAQFEEPFQKIRIKNPNAATMTVRLVVGFGTFKDDTLQAAGSIDSKPVVPDEIDEDSNVSVVTSTLTTLINENTSRGMLFITNLDPLGGQTIFVGNNPTGGVGIAVAPQATLAVASTAKWRCWHNKGANVSVAIAYTQWS